MHLRMILASICAMVLMAGTNANAGPNEDLINACRLGDVSAAQQAIDDGADPNAIDENGNSALGNAYFWPEITQMLIDNNADANGGDYPALVSASNNYSLEVMQKLIAAGADPNKPGVTVVDPGVGLRKLIEAEKAKGKDGNEAAIKVWEGVVKNMKPTRVEVSTLQIIVQQTNFVPGLELLIQNGADVAAWTDASGGNLLHLLGAFSQSQEMRREGFAKGKPMLESYGVTVPDWYAELPDDRNGADVDMLSLLLGQKLDVNQKNSFGQTPLAVAMGTQKLALSKNLIRGGADAGDIMTVKMGGEVAFSPVNTASEFGDVELVQLVLDSGADINTTVKTNALGTLARFKGTVQFGGDGYTPLICAIMSDNNAVAKYLVEQGADLKTGAGGISLLETVYENLFCLVDIKEKTPLYWAIEKEDMVLVQLIAERLDGKYNKKFGIKQRNAKGVTFGDYVYKCKKLKKKPKPSEWAGEIGNKDAQNLLKSMKM
jgi:ankyrin repeat protein